MWHAFSSSSFSKQQRRSERWKEIDTYRESEQQKDWVVNVTYHSNGTKQNWRYSMKQQVSWQMWLRNLVIRQLPEAKPHLHNLHGNEHLDNFFFSLEAV